MDAILIIIFFILTMIVGFLAGYAANNKTKLEKDRQIHRLKRENERNNTKISLLIGREKYIEEVISNTDLTWFQMVEEIKKLFIPNLTETDK